MPGSVGFEVNRSRDGREPPFDLDLAGLTFDFALAFDEAGLAVSPSVGLSFSDSELMQ